MRLRIGLAASIGLLMAFGSEDARANHETRTVTLVRAVCYGDCPAYSIVVHPDGFVEYEGEAHVRVVGKETSTMAVGDHQALMRAIDASRFEALARRFEKSGQCAVPDSRVVSISVESGKGRHRISHDVACITVPSRADAERFMKLADEIDSLAGTKRWMGSGADEH